MLQETALACGTLVAKPYLYMYDVVVLAVAVAFLLRCLLERGFATSDVVGSKTQVCRFQSPST